jgi:hypothetical protein
MADISGQELTEIYQFAIQLGKDAGKILLSALEQRRMGLDKIEDPEEKMNAVDIVTKTDNGMAPLQRYQTHVSGHSSGEPQADLTKDRSRVLRPFPNILEIPNPRLYRRGKLRQKCRPKQAISHDQQTNLGSRPA